MAGGGAHWEASGSVRRETERGNMRMSLFVVSTGRNRRDRVNSLKAGQFE